MIIISIGDEMEITPELIKQHGLSKDEYEHIKKTLGREPTYTELGIFSVMWSEHCSYKSSRAHLKKLPTEGPAVVQGPGENAGVVDIGDDLLICYKIESHNHPSFIEPYQGAATGVGGILRDIFTMGARPIACMNSLRFGEPSHPKTPYLVKGVVAGIGGYGNTMGIPTIGGEVEFDKCYNGNILVNAFAFGIMKKNQLHLGNASGVGNPVIYVGAGTGRDGIHGATMASEEFDEGVEERRPTVQVGDPFTEKLLMEACMEILSGDAVIGIQDMGAAGLTCSTFEMASRAGTGIEMDLDKVPQREEDMSSYEIMLSESQERMLIVAKKGRENEVMDVYKKWGLNAVVVGQVTDTKKAIIKHKGEVVVDILVDPISDEAPCYLRPEEEPKYLKETQKFKDSEIEVPKDLNKVLVKMMSTPTLGHKSWVWEQYDHMVITNTTIKPGSDAAVIRLKDASPRGVAMCCDGNARQCYLDPYIGATLQVAEAARNVSCSGAKPLAISNCLNFGNPEKPQIMWQFARTIEGMAEGCKQLETPVTGGNVSFYNETMGEGIHPTPVISMIGLIDDVNKCPTSFWKNGGDKILLLGEPEGEIGASFYLQYIHNRLAGRPQVVDWEREKAIQKACRAGIKRGVVQTAHDVSTGGLAVALAECCLRDEGLLGARVKIESEIRADALLFGEAPSRIIVAVKPKDVDLMMTIAKEEGAPVKLIGEVGGSDLRINNNLSTNIMELNESWRSAFLKVVK